MVSTAKSSSSYSTAVKKGALLTSGKPFFASTVCNIKTPPWYPGKGIPNTTLEHSFFVDLATTGCTQEEVADAMPSSVFGVVPRLDIVTPAGAGGVIEFACDERTVEDIKTTPFIVPNTQKTFFGILPRHKVDRIILVKMSNVPIMTEATLHHLLTLYWERFGTIIGLAPHKFRGKSWVTKRWDLLLLLPKDSKLEAPVTFKIRDDDPVICSWPGSKKACLKCKSAGHSSSNCPQSGPKVGASLDPEKILVQPPNVTQAAQKGPEVSKGVSGILEVSLVDCSKPPPTSNRTLE